MTFQTDRFDTLIARHSGIVTPKTLERLHRSGRVSVNAGRMDPAANPRIADKVGLDGVQYEVVDGGGRGRLQLRATKERGRITAPVRVHCGYHKCLTEFSKLVYGHSCRKPWLWRGRFMHFYHRQDAFYWHCDTKAMCSVSGTALDLSRFDDIRVVRFIRDPRDLLVSAYHYHRRGKEHWARLADPTDVDWWIVRARVPPGLQRGESLAAFLERVSVEEGLLAELDILVNHFDSMRQWPVDDPRVRLFHYRDIMGNEPAVFREIFGFLDLGGLTRLRGPQLAARYSAGRSTAKQTHIRNPASGQWRQHFTPRVEDAFRERYGDILERYGYE